MKKGIWVFGLFLVFVVGYVAAGPYLTVAAIETAIVEHDSEKLSANIEFPALRQNLKDQFNAARTTNAATELADNPFAMLATVFVAKIAEGIVDSFVTPKGLAALMQGKKPPRNGKDGNTPPPDKERLFKNARYSYDSPSKFSVWVPTEQGGEIRFVLQREGVSWKLVNLIIPIDEKS